MKAIFSLIISGALVVSGYAQTRNVLVGTNNAVVQPTNFWSADASNARTGLGLGTAATNPASAFQPSSSALTNLVSGNGGALTNLQATNLVGLIPTSNIPPIVLTNIGTITIAQGGTSATNAANARQNLGSTTVGDAVFIATNAAAARAVLGALSTSGDAINLTNFPTLLLRTNGNGAGLTNLTAANITGIVGLASNVSGVVAITNGGTGATNAAIARANLELGTTNSVEFAYVEAPHFFVGDGTNGIVFETDASRNVTLTNLGLGATNAVTFGQISIGSDLVIGDTTTTWGTNNRINYEERKLQGGNWTIDDGSLIIGGGTNLSLYQAQTRTNLGLPWSGLTNTNAATFQTALFGANTNPVLVDTNGEVVSPTNFWQVAPIATLLQNSTPVVNATNAATNARLLFLFSLAPSTVGVTNTITLPTNGNTFNGDVATITHAGPTSSVTAIRQLGASTNLITLNQVDETVRFLYRNDQWELMDNISYIEPIYFSGTNAAANAAASRTNLELGTTNDVTFNNVTASGTLTATGVVTTVTNLNVGGAIAVTNAAETRTNLGIPLAALTNTTVTNFHQAIFYTNTAPSNVGGNLGTIAAWIEIVASNGVTYKIPAYTNVP